MVKYQLRHGNDLLAWDSLRGCDVSVGRMISSCAFISHLSFIFFFYKKIVLYRKDRLESGVNKRTCKQTIKEAKMTLIIFSFILLKLFRFFEWIYVIRRWFSQALVITHSVNLFKSIRIISSKFAVCRWMSKNRVAYCARTTSLYGLGKRNTSGECSYKMTLSYSARSGSSREEWTCITTRTLSR